MIPTSISIVRGDENPQETPRLLSKSQWQRLFRKVRKGEDPVAYRPWKKVVPVLVTLPTPDGKPATYDPKEVDVPIELFSLEQTQPYAMSRRTAAYLMYYDIFAANGSPQRYIKLGTPDVDGKRWRSRIGRLDMSAVKSHVNAVIDRHTGLATQVGIVGGNRTRFQLLDLDLHDGDRDIFLQQARVLIDQFRGAGWHYIVADKDANGIHLIRALPHSADTVLSAFNLGRILAELDEANPDLVEVARKNGMKTLAEVEVYPDPDRGVRLPLCHARTVLLDRPLALVSNRKGRQVQDVEGYIAWIKNKDRQYMAKEEVLGYLKARLKPAAPPAAAGSIPKKRFVAQVEGGIKTKTPRKGQQAKIIHAFWDGAAPVEITLNQAVLDMARIMAHHPDFPGGIETAEEVLEQMVRDLPDYSVSQRLVSGDWKSIRKIIRQAVKTAFRGNSGQGDIDKSTGLLQAACDHWQRVGYLPWERECRLRFVSISDGQYRDLAFSQYHLDFMEQRIRPLLKTDSETTMRLMNYFLNMVFHHPGEISTYVLVKKILNDFGIPAGNDKLAAFMRLLREEEWLYIKTKEQWHVGSKGRSRSYGLGKNTIMLFKEPQAANANNNNTHTLQASIIISAGE